MSRLHPALGPVSRVAAVGVVVAGLLVGADRVGTPSTEAPPPEEVGEVATGQASLVCPGDPFAGDGAPDATIEGAVTLVPAGEDVLAGLVTPSDEPGATALTPGEVSGEPGSTMRTADLPADPVQATASGESAPGLIAGQQLVASGEEAHGLAVTPCGQPAADQWLVSGGGQPGRQERLVLANPGANPVTADLTFLTAEGPAEPGGGQGVVVPAGGRTVVLLDGLSGTETAQAVRVETSGGQVSAAVSDRWLDGLDPSGVELVGPTAAPSTRQVLPANANGAERGIVIAAPGEDDAVVEIRSIGEDGEESVDVTTVPGGSLAEVELPEAEGLHSWVLESDSPVVAGAWTLTGEAAGPDDTTVRDLSWSVAAPEIGQLGGVSVPTEVGDGSRALLDVVAGDEEASVEVLVRRGDDTQTQELRVPAGQSRSVDVAGADAAWVRTSAPGVRAGLLVQSVGQTQLAGTPVLPTPLTVRDVPVVALD